MTTAMDLSGPQFEQTRNLLSKLKAVLAYQSSESRDKVLDAADWMIELHYDQKPRPDGTPYINHPLDVCLAAAENFGFTEPDVLVAALLHDSVEDQAEKMAPGAESAADQQSSAVSAILGRFGQRPAQLVQMLTNPDWQHIDDPQQRNQLYREHFQSLSKRDPVAFALKLADFSTNALRLDQVTSPARFNKLCGKYCPVMADAIDILRIVPDADHPLSRVKQYMLPRLEAAVQNFCDGDV